jgi:hypothetical protein
MGSTRTTGARKHRAVDAACIGEAYVKLTIMSAPIRGHLRSSHETKYADQARPCMRFVETKTPEQQCCLMLHHVRHLFIRQQTRGGQGDLQSSYCGIVATVGRNGV